MLLIGVSDSLIFLRLELNLFHKFMETGELSGFFWHVVQKGDISFSLSITENGVLDQDENLSSAFLLGVLTKWLNYDSDSRFIFFTCVSV